MPIAILPTDALIAVDIENDFLPGGALAVADGDAVIEPTNVLIDRLPLTVATRDWHPANHISFKAQGGIWPVHCVAGTAGAAFPARLKSDGIDIEVRKADSAAQDAYSGFDGTGLAETLKAQGVKRVFITGLATDYCVRATALDALKAGFDTVVVRDAVRAVNVRPDDGAMALDAMAQAGATLADLTDIVA
jgi:nicotinamidase/pyrazinamidase